MLQCNSATGIKKQQKPRKLSKATLQQCYNATVLQELRNSKSNVAAKTMLRCNSATEIQKQ